MKNYLIHFFYNLILYSIFPFYLLHNLLTAIFNSKYRARFFSLIGYAFKDYIYKPNGVWIHAVSVGEVIASFYLIEKLLLLKPNEVITITCRTTTAYDLAMKKKHSNIQVLFAPIDINLIVRKYLRKISPSVLAIAEIELWPNLIIKAKKRNVSVLIYNGRMPEREYKNYLFFKSYIEFILSKIDFIGVQANDDKKRYIALGAIESKIQVIGNLKFDMKINSSNSHLSKLLNYKKKDKVIVAGSTHKGEEELIFKALFNLENKDFKIIIVPRNPERAKKVKKIAEKYGFKFIFFSKITVQRPSCLIIDTIGDLIDAYRLSTIVVIGGTFNKKIQGHNPLEALMFEKAVILGPCMNNFENIRNLLIKEQAVVETKDDYGSLKNKITYLLDNPEERKRIGENGYRLIKDNSGASIKYAECILNELSEKFENNN